jgi:uncharacterized phage protein (TIGR01671 family)
MSRPIKFRAWDKEKKQMLPVSSISFGDDGSALTVIFLTVPKEKYYRGLVDSENGILMQFTGLADRNSKEIYESDIVRYLDNTGYGLVEKTAFIEDIRHLPDFTCSKWEEVIGNMWEHPELLENVE